MDIDDLRDFVIQNKTREKADAINRTLQQAAEQDETQIKNQNFIYEYKLLADKVEIHLRHGNPQIIPVIINAKNQLNNIDHTCFRSLEYKKLLAELQSFFNGADKWARETYPADYIRAETYTYQSVKNTKPNSANTLRRLFPFKSFLEIAVMTIALLILLAIILLMGWLFLSNWWNSRGR